jgi:ethanolamine ammonia-lyase large subunit
MITRRYFLGAIAAGSAAAAMAGTPLSLLAKTNMLPDPAPPAAGEDLFSYILRTTGRFDPALYRQLLGSANEFKEGDDTIGIAAPDEEFRQLARRLLANSRICDLDSHPLFDDGLQELLVTNLDPSARNLTSQWALEELKNKVLTGPPETVTSFCTGLSSLVIACLVKIMDNNELILAGSRIFNPLPGSNIGARGYMGARIQPNSPTDNTDDILFQVFDGWSYGVGDVVVGTNPVSSDPESVYAVERTLQDVIRTFGLEEVLPHSVLAHIDIQAEVEAKHPESTGIWFQSIAGSDSANATFDVTNEKMLRHASARQGKYGLYFETGQGADFTNGHAKGVDMVIHESRKYGFARVLKAKVADAQTKAGRKPEPWVHLNDVAGFIGPEVFRRKEQLVRCCLEDIVMGKLHGITIGLDICATLHMDITLDDLDWCIDQVMPANPAYLMALPTKIDPMLGYLTTGFQDHVRIRDKFGFRVNDPMWSFFKELGVISPDDKPGPNFGNPLQVFLRYNRLKGDDRSETAILEEGRQRMEAIRKRGVFLASGHGEAPWQLDPALDLSIRKIDADARKCIWAEFTHEFLSSFSGSLNLASRSANRGHYILRPETGEQISEESHLNLKKLRRQHQGAFNVQIVASDGLNALSIMEPGHLKPFLAKLGGMLKAEGFNVSPVLLMLTSGRVRAGYRIGETLFSKLEGPRAILHIIGERPGTGHRTFSVYITSPDGQTWAQTGKVDHNITKVVSGIATTALDPLMAPAEVVKNLKSLIKTGLPLS